MTPNDLKEIENLRMYCYILAGQVATLVSLVVYFYTQLQREKKERMKERDDRITGLEAKVTGLERENSILKERK